VWMDKVLIVWLFWLASEVWSQALSGHPYSQSQAQVETPLEPGSVSAHVLLLLTSQMQHLLASLSHYTPRLKTTMQAASFFLTPLLVTGRYGGPTGAPSPLL
ncbi:hypothetical protein BDA96_09G059100, partial [Sorghum bicolor]